MRLRIVLSFLGFGLFSLVGAAGGFMGLMIAAFNDTGEPFDAIWPTMRLFFGAAGLAFLLALLLLGYGIAAIVRSRRAAVPPAPSD